MLGVFAKVTVKSGQFARFWRYLEADITGTRVEPGCLRFDVLRDAETPSTLYLYEVYRDRAAFDLHREAPYFKAFFAEAGDTLAAEPEVRLAEVVSPVEDEHWPKA